MTHPPGWWEAVAALIRPLDLADDGTVRAGSFLARPGPLSSDADDGFVDEDPRVERLQRHIYATYYAAIAPSAADNRASWSPDGATLQSGPWRVVETLQGGAVVAQRGPCVRRLEAGEYVYDGVPVPVRRGAWVTRYRARFSDQLDPGFFYLFGASEIDAFSEDSHVRYYLHVMPDRVRIAVDCLLSILDGCAIPFFLKYPASEAAMARSDALVIYAGARYAATLHQVLADRVMPEIAEALRPRTPLWALPLAPGLAFAQEPDSGESFGASRSRSLARGLVAAAEAPRTPVLSHVRRAFADDAIDWDHPHLNDDPLDRYGLKSLAFGNPMGEGHR